MSRGDRFELDLDSDSESERPASSRTPAATSLSFNLVKDISEKDVSDEVPPPPQLKDSIGGFPVHELRGPSRFKQRQQQRAGAAHAQSPQPTLSSRNGFAPKVTQMAPKGARQQPSPLRHDLLPQTERARIDAENRQTLAAMSEDEIAQERAELLAGGVPGLTPSLIERLMRRADIEQGTAEMDEGGDTPATEFTRSLGNDSKSSKKVSFAESPPQAHAQTTDPSPPSQETAFPPKPPSAPARRHDPDAPPLVPPADLHPASSPDSAPRPVPTVHFAAPSEPYAALDPSSPSFLSDLRTKYFPNLAHDPSSLSWMNNDSSYPYSPSDPSIAPSDLRFDFAGRLVPPSVAAQLPTDLGLHHHAHAPEAAGYTIPELAILQRSTLAAQRVVAHQTLGRVLYRLGKGEFGREGEELCEGLWKVVAGERVLQVLMAEVQSAERGSKSRSAVAVATEAVWLWQQAGGRTGKEGATR